MFKQEKTKRKRDAVALLMLKSVARYLLCRLSLPAVTVSDAYTGSSTNDLLNLMVRLG